MIYHKQNQILRVLTVFSVVILPLTLISGIYGMNFQHIPFASAEHGFWDVVGVMLVLAGGMLAYFRHKRWI